MSLTGASKETSKAADDFLLDTDLDIEAENSCRSFASSITTPPSQTGSFYQKVQQQQEDQVDVSGRSSALGSLPSDGFSDMTSEDDVQSMNSWGGFSISDQNNSKSNANADRSIMTSPTPSSRKIKSKRTKKGKRRLKDFFRFNSQKNQPITEEEVDEDGTAAVPAEVSEEHGKEGSMSLADESANKDISTPATTTTTTPTTATQSKTATTTTTTTMDDQASVTSRQSRSSRRSLKATFSDSTSATGTSRASRKKKPQRRGSVSSKQSTKSNKSMKSTSNRSPTREERKKSKKSKRRGSLGAFRRLSMGGAKEEEKPREKTPPPPPPSTPGSGRRHSMGGNDEDANNNPRRSTLRRRSSLGSMILGRRSSIGNSENNTTNAIPEDYHSVIHRERAARSMYLFERNFVLDTLAQGIANDLAAGRSPTPCEFYGNIGKGTSLTVIHTTIMEERKGISRKNILSDRYTEFGMGVAIGQGGGSSIFMCTLFK